MDISEQSIINWSRQAKKGFSEAVGGTRTSGMAEILNEAGLLARPMNQSSGIASIDDIAAELAENNQVLLMVNYSRGAGLLV